MPNKIDLRKLPPLNALKGFEATTRRKSVREAAEELCVTHPAISHQIQLLEADIGVPLFSREGRKIISSAEGQLLYPYVRKALELLIEGAETVRRARVDQPLRVQTYVTASVRWLARRIPSFTQQHPEINLLLNTCSFEWDFDESLADVGLVYAESLPGPEFHWTPLFDYRLFPVCTPALRATLGSNPTPKDLLSLPLVSIYTEARNWDIWFESAQVDYIAQPRIVVDTLAVALEIVLEGRAAVLVNGPFVEEDLRLGRLVQPVSHSVQCPGGWGLICRPEKRDNWRVSAFIDYVVKACAGYV